MERINFESKLKDLFGKYKYVLLILFIGILLMSIPDSTTNEDPQKNIISHQEPISRAEELEIILGQISGVGKVEVLLTEAAGAETLYQTDEDRKESDDANSIHSETVIISNSAREEHGLIRTIIPPVYLGAIVVCQGGDSPSVKLSVVQAVSSVTGISSERIIVLKMK